MSNGGGSQTSTDRGRSIRWRPKEFSCYDGRLIYLLRRSESLCHVLGGLQEVFFLKRGSGPLPPPQKKKKSQQENMKNKNMSY